MLGEEIDFKLAHTILRAGKSEFYRTVQQSGDPGK